MNITAAKKSLKETLERVYVGSNVVVKELTYDKETGNSVADIYITLPLPINYINITLNIP